MQGVGGGSGPCTRGSCGQGCLVIEHKNERMQMHGKMYCPPVAEVLTVREERGFLTDSDQVGRADVGYTDNEMEEL